MDLTIHLTGLCGLILQDVVSSTANTRVYKTAFGMLLSGGQDHGMDPHGMQTTIHRPRLIIPAASVKPTIQADELLAIEGMGGRTELALWNLDSCDVEVLDSTPLTNVAACFAKADPANPNFKSLEFLADTRRASSEAGAAFFNPTIFDPNPDGKTIAGRVMLQRGTLACDVPSDPTRLFDFPGYSAQQFAESIRCDMTGLNRALIHLRGFGPNSGKNSFIELQPVGSVQPAATISNLPNTVPATAAGVVQHFRLFYDVYLPMIDDDDVSRPAPRRHGISPHFVEPAFCLMASLSEA